MSMTGHNNWPPAGHDRQRELFSDDAEPCEPTAVRYPCHLCGAPWYDRGSRLECCGDLPGWD